MLLMSYVVHVYSSSRNGPKAEIIHYLSLYELALAQLQTPVSKYTI